MNQRQQTFHEFWGQFFSPYRNLQSDPVEQAWERVLDRARNDPEGIFDTAGDIPETNRREFPVFAGVLAGFTAVAVIVLSVALRNRHTSPVADRTVVESIAVGTAAGRAAELAVVESIDGTLHLDSNGTLRAMRAGDVIPTGNPIRTGVLGGAMIALPDHSRVEIASNSELSLEAANDGMRIHLDRGAIIIKQKDSHLEVRTRDIEISAMGALFMVRAEDLLSQVGVVSGEDGGVHVRKEEAEISLRAGQQISSTSFVNESLETSSLAWSRNASEYIALWTGGGAPALPRPQNSSFDVVSIKRNLSVGAGGGMGPRGNRLVATNVTLKNLLVYAYTPAGEQFLNDQVIGAPAWSDVDHFDIDAKMADGAGRIPVAQLPAMIQSLLEERFQLKAHRDTKELPIYNLVLSKAGAKLSADQTPPPPNQTFITFVTEGEPLGELPRGAARIVQSPAGIALTGTAIPLSSILSTLQGRSDRIIIDKTNFKGLLDVDAQFPGESGAQGQPGTPIDSLLSAVEFMGLKLESGKAVLPVVIVDSVRAPSPN